MARRPKLTQEMSDEAIRRKADGLSNGDIVCALGIHEPPRRADGAAGWPEPRSNTQAELAGPSRGAIHSRSGGHGRE